jgi:hypothetical protein
MKSLTSFIALVALGTSVTASAAEPDPLTEYLVTVKHFSNVPYTDQVRVAAGGYVAYDTEHRRFPPVWEGPVEGESPIIMQGVEDIPIPSETLNKLRSLNLDIRIFGLNPMAKLQSGGHIEYSEMILKPSALRDANAFYALLTPGSALDKEFREYGGNGSTVYKNQHLYAILTVYYSTGVTITSDKYIGIGGSTGDTIASCQTSISPAAPRAPKPGEVQPPAAGGTAQGGAASRTQNPSVNPAAPAAAANPKGSDTQSKDTLASIATASAKAALIAAGQAAGGEAGETVAGSGGAAAAKSTGNQAAAAAVKVASGALPGGGGNYCRVDGTHVEFHSTRPVPIAAQLLRVIPLEDGQWNLLSAIVKFDGEKTTEISH